LVEVQEEGAWVVIGRGQARQGIVFALVAV